MFDRFIPDPFYYQTHSTYNYKSITCNLDFLTGSRNRVGSDSQVCRKHVSQFVPNVKKSMIHEVKLRIIQNFKKIFCYERNFLNMAWMDSLLDKTFFLIPQEMKPKLCKVL